MVAFLDNQLNADQLHDRFGKSDYRPPLPDKYHDVAADFLSNIFTRIKEKHGD